MALSMFLPRSPMGRLAQALPRLFCGFDMALHPTLFSSDSDDWETPLDLFRELDHVFHFDLDPCATTENAKCERHFTTADDGLKQHWEGTVWMNPPYGEVERWMKKAFEQSCLGATVLCLVPARTDTEWWYEYARRGQIIFIKGRLKFGGGDTCAPFPSAIVIFFAGRLGEAVRGSDSQVRVMNTNGEAVLPFAKERLSDGSIQHTSSHGGRSLCSSHDPTWSEQRC